jgi:hypothetical protein
MLSLAREAIEEYLDRAGAYDLAIQPRSTQKKYDQ